MFVIYMYIGRCTVWCASLCLIVLLCLSVSLLVMLLLCAWLGVSCRSAVFVPCLHFICGCVLAALCHSLLYSQIARWWLPLLHDFMYWCSLDIFHTYCNFSLISIVFGTQRDFYMCSIVGCVTKTSRALRLGKQ